jgi:hypothetical protein
MSSAVDELAPGASTRPQNRTPAPVSIRVNKEGGRQIEPRDDELGIALLAGRKAGKPHNRSLRLLQYWRQGRR